MEELDSPLRLRKEHGVERQGPHITALEAASKRFAPTTVEVAALSAQLYARIVALAPDEIWFPLGVGENPDHVRTSRVCMTLLNAEKAYFESKRVSLYEDLSVFDAFVGHAERVLAVHRRTGVLRQVDEDITTVFSDKVRATSLYGSQWDMPRSEGPRMGDMIARVTASANLAPRSGRKLERRYEVVQIPRLPVYGEVAFHPVDLAAAKVALAPWIRIRPYVERLTIFNPGSFGSWRIGVDVLRGAFPNATIDVVATEDYFWETSTAAAPSITAVRACEGDFPSLLERVAQDDLVLLIGDPAALRGAAHLKIVRTPTFGDAITALSELVAE
jgi:hypothetical protein